MSWCNQLKVLCHSSVGGFWTHCGWNSTPTPMVAFPLFFNQDPKCMQIVEKWIIRWQMKKDEGPKHLVKGEKITAILVSHI